MLNIVIPMAGAGSRFAREGYFDPKPLIPVEGVPMIRLVIENLRPRCDYRFIFICQAAHVAQYDLTSKLNAWVGNRLIAAGAKVGIYNIGSEAAGMYSLGIPSDLKLFTSMPVHRKALDPCL